MTLAVLCIRCQYRPVAEDRVRTAEVVGSLCMATDVGMALPFGHGLGSTVVAMRLADRLGVDQATAVQTYYGCLLFYAGCTADADVRQTYFPMGSPSIGRRSCSPVNASRWRVCSARWGLATADG